MLTTESPQNREIQRLESAKTALMYKNVIIW